MKIHNKQNIGRERIVGTGESPKSPINIDKFESRGPERVVPNYCVFGNLQNHRVLLNFPPLPEEK